MSVLSVFDVDETLFKTKAKVLVRSGGEVIAELSNKAFNSYVLDPGEEFDFSQFRSADYFAKTSEPILPMIRRLKAAMDKGHHVRLLTARGDFDCKDTFLQSLAQHGIDPSRLHVDRAGNLSLGTSAQNKAYHFARYLATGVYSMIRFYDDHKANLKALLDFKEQTKADLLAYHVKPNGNARLFRG